MPLKLIPMLTSLVILAGYVLFIRRGSFSTQGREFVRFNGFKNFTRKNCADISKNIVNNSVANVGDDLDTAVVHRLIKIITEDYLGGNGWPVSDGDIVEVDTSPDCKRVGVKSLVAALVQRALKTPICRHRQMSLHMQELWLVIPDERCVVEVRERFSKHSFSIIDHNQTHQQSHNYNSSSTKENIHLLVGNVRKTLADSHITGVSLLLVSGNGNERELRHARTLEALVSLYRRVHLGGYVLLENYDENYKIQSRRCKGHALCSADRINCTAENSKWSQEMDDCDFFSDARGSFERVGASRQKLMKKADRNVRMPAYFRRTLEIDDRVEDAWRELGRWHRESVRNFVGHVGTNTFQSYRYIEAMRHVVERAKRRWANGKRSGRGDNDKPRVNICETGYNGGHSAQLFLSFLSDDVDVHYYGWDLGKVASARPVAQRMQNKYGDNFHITWGDSHETLLAVEETMKGQLCDLIVIDGDHSKAGVVDDLHNLLRVASRGALIFGDDCAPWKRTVPQSAKMLEGWMEFVENGRIISVANYRNPDMQSPGFVEGLVPNEDGSYSLEL